MPAKKKPAFSEENAYSDAYQYLVSLGINPPRKRPNSSQVNHEKQVIREARKAKALEEQGQAPSKEAGRGKHGGKAKEQHALPIYKIDRAGYHPQYIMYNFPSKVTGHEINAKDIAALYKAAGSPRKVNILVSGTVRYSGGHECEPKTLTASTGGSTIAAIVKRKLDLFTVANDLLRYGPDAEQKEWCTIDYIGMYATPEPKEKPGRRRIA